MYRTCSHKHAVSVSCGCGCACTKASADADHDVSPHRDLTAKQELLLAPYDFDSEARRARRRGDDLTDEQEQRLAPTDLQAAAVSEAGRARRRGDELTAEQEKRLAPIDRYAEEKRAAMQRTYDLVHEAFKQIEATRQQQGQEEELAPLWQEAFRTHTDEVTNAHTSQRAGLPCVHGTPTNPLGPNWLPVVAAEELLQGHYIKMTEKKVGCSWHDGKADAVWLSSGRPSSDGGPAEACVAVYF